MNDVAKATEGRRIPARKLAVFVLLGLGVAAAFADVGYDGRSRLVAAEVASLAAWLGLAVIGHVHKIVPFIAYSTLRARGVDKGPTGRPLMFSDLFDKSLARVALGAAGAGFAAAVAGVLVASVATVALGGVGIAVAGAVVVANLTIGPRRAAAYAAPTTALSLGSDR